MSKARANCYINLKMLNIFIMQEIRIEKRVLIPVENFRETMSQKNQTAL